MDWKHFFKPSWKSLIYAVIMLIIIFLASGLGIISRLYSSIGVILIMFFVNILLINLYRSTEKLRIWIIIFSIILFYLIIPTTFYYIPATVSYKKALGVYNYECKCIGIEYPDSSGLITTKNCIGRTLDCKCILPEKSSLGKYLNLTSDKMIKNSICEKEGRPDELFIDPTEKNLNYHEIMSMISIQ
jgi:hypothetical protein